MHTVRTAGALGYCSGVSQAIDRAINYAGAHGTVYSWGPLAHNEHVVANLIQHGVKPISTAPEVLGAWRRFWPKGGFADVDRIAVTAHGAPPDLYKTFQDAGLDILDCTCPIVREAQAIVSQRLDGFDILIFGDPAHQEVIGLDGWAGGAKFIGRFHDLFSAGQDFKALGLGSKLGIISQTTSIPSMYADFVTTLVSRVLGEFDELRVFNTICPIVASRIAETRKLASEVDIMFVVGSQESANTKNLATVARSGVGSDFVHIVQNADQVEEALKLWEAQVLGASLMFGVTAGTSTPFEVVKEVVGKLEESLHERTNSN